MNKDKTILIVDDEAELRQMVQGIFARAGYGQVLTAGTGAEALALCRQAMPDLVILDVMLPDIDGFAVLRALRQDSRVPVLMLTARGEAEDKFAGFEAGADDYLAKPFLPRELLFRAQAILRRTCPDTGGRVQLAAASVDLGTATARRGQDSYPLTAKELLLFRKLYENAGRIVTTGALCEAVCGPVWQGYESTLATHIRHLREKIESNPLQTGVHCDGEGAGLPAGSARPQGDGAMNGVERFFRRYVFSTLGLLALLFAANVAVLAGLLLVGEMTVPTAFSITAFCDNLTGSGGDWKVNVVGQQMLDEREAWAMVLDPAGQVAWKYRLPPELDHPYTAGDIARFSRSYLEDWPVTVWAQEDGSLVVVGRVYLRSRLIYAKWRK